ncbi:hypothetical protein PQJ75_22515 [Rhodoplanes sp. TEM]|uniref:Uncharacterized protein n=1 Tax=Rhodoplanes tepidamans TaxID=200616 RepID=A0ABT5JGM4_RHOTP|nr:MULTISPECIES: hypothetical protein [Rhodoplanes]MDC7788180.1 hypothetical protein [Rhodoplanes tepidamans]MDC7986511.1 hypothetical protein [Rhodoplanes sp. TEM]MDQ0355130.1 hypothetical protein [Rhodoplanes tepidamans]
MKTLTLLLTLAGLGIGAANAETLDVRQLIDQRWMAAAPTGESWTCPTADAATIQAAFEGQGAADLTVALNDDPRPDDFRGPMAADIPVLAFGSEATPQ